MSLDVFTPAELYHQKFYLQSDRLLMSELFNGDPGLDDLMNTTAAARINGYISGYGSIDALKKEIEGYGLSDEGRQYLLKKVK